MKHDMEVRRNGVTFRLSDKYLEVSFGTEGSKVNAIATSMEVLERRVAEKLIGDPEVKLPEGLRMMMEEAMKSDDAYFSINCGDPSVQKISVCIPASNGERDVRWEFSDGSKYYRRIHGSDVDEVMREIMKSASEATERRTAEKERQQGCVAVIRETAPGLFRLANELAMPDKGSANMEYLTENFEYDEHEMQWNRTMKVHMCIPETHVLTLRVFVQSRFDNWIISAQGFPGGGPGDGVQQLFSKLLDKRNADIKTFLEDSLRTLAQNIGYALGGSMPQKGVILTAETNQN